MTSPSNFGLSFGAVFGPTLACYPFGELDEVMLSYAVSIHKSQGSKYPAVVIPVMTQHYAMLERNLLYTGVTPWIVAWTQR